MSPYTVQYYLTNRIETSNSKLHYSKTRANLRKMTQEINNSRNWYDAVM